MAVEHRLQMALKDKAYETVASSTTVSERDDRYMVKPSACSTRKRSTATAEAAISSLYSPLGWGATCGREGKEALHLGYTRAVGTTDSGRHDRRPQERVACERRRNALAHGRRPQPRLAAAAAAAAKRAICSASEPR